MPSADYAPQHRKLTYWRKGAIFESQGRDVRIVERGFLIIAGKIRVLIPNSQVIDFTYHVDDSEARRYIEGIQQGRLGI